MDQLDTQISQSIISFIDILLDFYPSLPSCFTNQIRSLQACLLTGKTQDLNKLTSGLRSRLEVKDKCKYNQPSIFQGRLPSKIKSFKTENDSNKENSFSMNNCNPAYTCKTVKKHDNSLSILSQHKHRNTSVTQSNEKSFDVDFYNSRQKLNKFGRNPNKTFIKVTKKRKPSEETLEATHQSFSKGPYISKVLGLKVEQILSIMDSLQLTDHQEGKIL